MGRRTWESLPDGYAPAGPAQRRPDLRPALVGRGRAGTAASVPRCSPRSDDFWVIGGGAVYAAFLPHADRLVVTDVDVRGRGGHLGAGRGDGWQPGGADAGGGLVESVVGGSAVRGHGVRPGHRPDGAG